MRIAVSGTHLAGKTTLVEALSRALPHHVVIDEPYHLLEDDGYQFAAPPSLEDFEAQLDRSIESILEGEPDRIFDRCPADLLAYLLTHADAKHFDLEYRLPSIHEAMQQIDRIVFVPLEDPDRVAVSAQDLPALRRLIDAELRELVLEDRLGFGVEALEVTGTLGERVRQVMARVHPVPK